MSKGCHTFSAATSTAYAAAHVQHHHRTDGNDDQRQLPGVPLPLSSGQGMQWKYLDPPLKTLKVQKPKSEIQECQLLNPLIKFVSTPFWLENTLGLTTLHSGHMSNIAHPRPSPGISIGFSWGGWAAPSTCATCALAAHTRMLQVDAARGHKRGRDAHAI